MHALARQGSVRILIPREEGAKGKMLNHGELGKDLGVEHLDHAFVNLSPSVSDARYIKEDRTVLPEWTLLDVVDEADGREIHV
jgi:hypothetical protein